MENPTDINSPAPNRSRATRLLTGFLAAIVLTLVAAACANTPPNPAGAPAAIGFVDDIEIEGSEDAPPATLPEGWSPFPSANDAGADSEAPADVTPEPADGDLESSAPVIADVPDRLAFVAEQTAARNSFLFSFEAEVADGARSMNITGQGAVDGEFAAIQIDMSDLGKQDALMAQLVSTPMTVISAGDREWLRWPSLTEAEGLGDPWIALEGADEALFDVDELSPELMLSDLRAFNSDVKEVGTTEIGGVTVTHYVGSVTEQGRTADVEAWVGDDGLLRKMTVNEAGDWVAMTFSGFGDPVSIDLPDPTNTISSSEVGFLQG